LLLRLFSLVLLVPYIAIANSTVSAQTEQSTSKTTQPNFNTQIDEYLDSQRSEHNIPALSIAILHDGLIDYTYAAGKQGYKTSADERSMFHAASISKLFTATAIMQLAEKKLLSLDQSASDFLPGLQNTGITIQHLLTHQAGLKNRVRAKHSTDRNSLDAYVAKATKAKPSYTPGKSWAYNDTNYNLLGAIIKKASGIEFDRYVRANILQPLGMEQSSFFLPDINPEKIATPHRGKTPKPLKMHPYDINFAPSSGLQTNASELALFINAHLQSDPKLLSPTSYAKMQTVYSSTKWKGIEQGLAWQILADKNGNPILQHGGSDPGFRALVIAYPRDKSAYIILSNGEKTPRWEIAAQLRKMHIASKR